MLPAVSFFPRGEEGVLCTKDRPAALQMVPECFPEQLSWSRDTPAAGGEPHVKWALLSFLLCQRSPLCICLKKLYVNRNV